MRNAQEIVSALRSMADPAVVASQQRFGIETSSSLGIPTPALRTMASQIKRERDLDRHVLAMELWAAGLFEARMLASMLADPKRLTSSEMDAWTGDFDSWAICDGCCYNLFRYSPLAWEKIDLYAPREEEYVRRTSFALLAGLAIGDKKVEHERFAPYFDMIEKYSTDGRNFVRKAVNWALRQIGKRTGAPELLDNAIEVSARLAASDDKSARWIGCDALRELQRVKAK